MYYSERDNAAPAATKIPPTYQKTSVERITRPVTPPRAAQAASFVPGDRVKHMTFGEGEILSVKPMGADTLYEIAFDRVGTKKLMGTYAKLKKV